MNFSGQSEDGRYIAGANAYESDFNAFDGIDSAPVVPAQTETLLPGESASLTCEASAEYNFCKLSVQRTRELDVARFYDVSDGVECGKSVLVKAEVSWSGIGFNGFTWRWYSAP